MTSEYEAVLFDLDGVLVPTATVHQRAWTELFSRYLEEQGIVEPYTDEDYYTYIDGKPRFQGVAALLESRGIEIPWGEVTDLPTANTVCGLGNRKNVVFLELLELGIDPYPEVVGVLSALAYEGVKVAVVTSSRNGPQVLRQTGLAREIPVVVDGNITAEEGLPGKPAPDAFLLAAARLGIDPDKAVVVEDAISGVKAGKAGGFGLTIGVDRGEVGAEALYEAGADRVVTNLDQILDIIRTDRGEEVAADKPPADPVDRSRFPVDEWKLIEVEQGERQADQLSATLFNQGNGYLGIRGDGEPFRELESSTFINGFHETFTIVHAENAYGFAHVGQTIQGLPDGVGYRIAVDGVDLHKGELLEGRTELDFRTGVTTSVRLWQTEADKRIRVTERRLVALFDPHQAAVEVSVVPLDSDAEVETIFITETRRSPGQDTTGFQDPRLADRVEDGGLDLRYARLSISGWCRNSLLGFACNWRDDVVAPWAQAKATTHRLPDGHVEAVTSGLVGKNQQLTVTRYLSYYAQSVPPQGVAGGLAVTAREDNRGLRTAASRSAARARKLGFDELMRRQVWWLKSYWDKADIEIRGAAPAVQQAVRWSMFQLAQVSAQLQPNTSIAAKGVSGSGYSGHTFWDTEIFVQPFFTYTNPALARRILDYRHAMLPAARRRAEVMAVDGALYPWRTINGEEASAYYPAGTAQYHIDADIAYAVAQYVMVSGDKEFLAQSGIDILVETARMWASLGFIGADGYFHIHQVTGPDEYSAVVDDNFYTNAMARFNMLEAATALESLPPSVRQKAVERLSITEEEVDNWRACGGAMMLQWNDEYEVHPQDAMFLQRKPWIPDDNPAPLLLRYHPLVIYRHQILKQADVVLAMQLLSGEFTDEEKRANFDYYDPLTTGDSTLSAPTQCAMAAATGHMQMALDYFLQLLYTDLADRHGNASVGIHVASTGGVWQALINGFAGLRDLTYDIPALEPRLPSEWEQMTFSLVVHGTWLRFIVTHDVVTIERIEGGGAELTVWGEKVALDSSQSQVEVRVPHKS